MPLGRPLTASEIGYFGITSPLAFGAAACSNPVDLSNYEFATLAVHAGSVNTGAAVYVQRSATSNGTFAGIGASLSFGAGGQYKTVSFSTVSSAVWYRVARNNGTGSAVLAVSIHAQNPRSTPITQPTNTSSNDPVLNP